MTNKFNINMFTTTSIMVAALALSACGGGSSSAGTPASSGSSDTGTTSSGSGSTNTGSTNTGGTTTGGTTTTTAQVPAGTTNTTASYAAGSGEAAIFTKINSYRSACGLPAFSQNTILDAAAASHVTYMADATGTVTDTEAVGQPGFTGATATDRAVAKGWPNSIGVGTQSAGVINNSLSTPAQYGGAAADAWSTGVYHQMILTYPANLAGVATGSVINTGYYEYLTSINFASDGTAASKITSAPATFPCQGITGIPPKGAGESPRPPVYQTYTTSGGTVYQWGTPVTVVGNLTDTVTLTTASMTAPDGTVIQMNVLTSATDPAHLILPNASVAWPTNVLSSNTTYTVNLTGTYNGQAFSRSFTFTTGS